jgi:hypothetical protein
MLTMRKEVEMSKWRKFVAVLAVVAAMLLTTTGLVLAQGYDDTWLYGLVFVDANGNGVFDVGEQGFEGATITLNPGDPDETITLQSASARALEEHEKLTCTVQDYFGPDGTDDDEDPDVKETPTRPCAGTFGIRPAGPKKMVWEVTLTPPAGYVVTSANPQYIKIAGDTPLADFGVAPAGAGGPVAAGPVVLPVTGEALVGLLAIASLLIGGSAIALGKRSRR